VKTQERIEARRFRREQGLPIKEIARRLGVAVSTVSIWVRDVELSPQHEALRALNPAYNHQRNGWKTNATRFRSRRVSYQEEGRDLARRYEPLHMRAACCTGQKAHENEIRSASRIPTQRWFGSLAPFFVGTSSSKIETFGSRATSSQTI
jgi:transcriptional regulator with XRE-family HTH domain